MRDQILRVLKNKNTARILLGAVVLIIYSNVYDMAFVYDDEFYIQKNQFLSSFENAGKLFLTNSTAGSGFEDSFYRPVQFFFYLLTQQIFGTEPWGFHLLNVLIHSFNAILIFALGVKLGLRQITAFLAAVLWAAHPVHTEVIAYISGTADPLQCFFTLSSLLLLLSNHRFSLLGSCLLFIVAMLCKEVAVVFPGLATAVLFLKSEKRLDWKTYRPVALYLLLGLIYVGLRASVLNFNGDFHFYKSKNIYTESLEIRFLTFLATIPEYLKVLVWPVDQHIDRAFFIYTEWSHAQVVAGILILLSLLSLCALLWRFHRRAGVFAIAMTMWFASAHSLHSGILVPMNSLFLEHWLYVPSIALFWAAAVLLQKIPIRLALTITAAAVVTLGMLTYKQNRMWESPITLFSRILKFNPKASRVRHNLAMAYSDNGQDDLALKEYEISLQDQPQKYPQTYHNMALIYLKRNDFATGESLLLKAIEISPRFHPSYAYLIQLYKFTKQNEKAIEWENKYKSTFNQSL